MEHTDKEQPEVRIDGADRTPQPSAVDVGIGLPGSLHRKESPEARRISTLAQGFAIVSLFTLFETLDGTRASSPNRNFPGKYAGRQPDKVEMIDNTRRAESVEIKKLSTISLSLGSNNKHFTIQGNFWEPAIITVSALDTGEVVSFRDDGGSHFVISSSFKRPVEGYKVTVTKHDGTPLDVGGQSQIWNRNKAQKEATSVTQRRIRSGSLD